MTRVKSYKYAGCQCDQRECFAYWTNGHRSSCSILRERADDGEGRCKFFKKRREWTKGKFYPGGYSQ